MARAASKSSCVVTRNSALDFCPVSTPTLDLLISNTWSNKKYSMGKGLNWVLKVRLPERAAIVWQKGEVFNLL